jgi:hypothetical protein
MNDFPKIDSSAKIVSCFNCYQDLYDFYAVPSGNAAGRGAFYACCESCGMRSFFDFIEADDGNLQKNA